MTQLKRIEMMESKLNASSKAKNNRNFKVGKNETLESKFYFWPNISLNIINIK